MKNVFLCALMLLLSMSALAQDKIVTNVGDIIVGYGLEITSNAIFYKTSIDSNASFERLDKSSVAMIIHADGTKTVIDNSNETSQQAATPVAAPVVANQESSAANEVENKRLIAEHNTFDLSYRNNDAGKKADVLLFAIGVSEDSQLCNDDIEVSFSSNWYNSQDMYVFHNADIKANTSSDDIIVTIKNKTDNNIYIDLQRVMISRGNQTATFYDGSIITESKSSTVGGAAGFGFAGVAAANTNTTNITHQNARVVTVPPHFTVNLPAQGLDHMLKANTKGGYYSAFANLHPSMSERFVHIDADVRRGEIHSYTVSNAPFKIMLAINYSFAEDFSKTKTVTAQLYPCQLVGMNCIVTTGWSVANCAINRTDLNNPMSIKMVLTKMVKKTAQKGRKGFGAMMAPPASALSTSSSSLPIY